MASPGSRPGQIRRFGAFELDLQSGELRKFGLRLKVQGKPLQILEILLEKEGEVVSREELQRALWSEDTFVDFEGALSTAIRKLRVALGDSAENPRFVETVGRRGYRFIASSGNPQLADEKPADAGGRSDQSAIVAANGNGSLPELPVSAGLNATFEPSREISIAAIPAGSAPGKKAWLWLTVVIVLGIVSVYPAWHFAHRAQPQSHRIMLAVLPFENLTGDAAQEYFSDGLTEEMISQLGRLDPQRLGVVSRTSVMRYKHTQTELGQVGRELGIEYVLEGGVRRDANHVRISTQLIQIKDQTPVWSRQYDRDLTSVLALQNEIAEEVADEIQLTLGDHKIKDSAHAAPLSADAYQAYDLYLQGRYFLNQRPQGFRQAAGHFEQAIAKDPGYAPAYAGLADTYALMSTWYDADAPQNAMPKARAAALKAMEIDETLAEAHASLALVAESYDYDWQTAEKQFRRAIELDPAYATAHQWYAECLSRLGRFPEALAESERARQLDPFSAIIATDHAAILLYSRDYDRAIEQAQAALEMEPNSYRTYGIFLSGKIHQGKLAEALADIQKWDRTQTDADALAYQAYIYGRMGKQAEARHALSRLKQIVQAGDRNLTRLPLAYTGMGQKDEAIRLLQVAYSQHSNSVLVLKVDPFYDSLRSDPRFQTLLHQVHLEQ